MFKKILIANRGEIAVRVIRACKEWGISTVAIHSDVDRDSMHVRLADESICVGPHQPSNSYLNIPAIMSAIELTNSEAVHPGYGFLSENAEFAKILEDNNIKFIGPSSSLISKMGDKIQAKKIAKQYGLPVIEGSEGGVSDIKEAKKLSENIGFPVLIKAAGGGGGKGMKIVEEENKLESLFLMAKTEAKKFFNKEFDLDGSLSAQGSINQISANNFIDRFIFEKNVNISFDTADFSISEFRGLNKLDGLKTLTFITAELILEFCKRNNLKKSLVCGGGRKNKTLMRFPTLAWIE